MFKRKPLVSALSALSLVLLSLSLLALPSCKAEQVPYEEADFWCPGDYSGVCEDTGVRDLFAGAAALTITPLGFEQWIDVDGNLEEFHPTQDAFRDCGLDRLCPADDGYTGADADGTEGDGIKQAEERYFEINGKNGYEEGIDILLDCGVDGLCPADAGYTAPDEGEGDGFFQKVWMAGFGTARPANGIHDDLWARAIVLEQGETTIGIVSLDVVGWFYDNVLHIRDAARKELGIDHVIVQATHTHEGPDTVGIWGENELTSGVDPSYMAWAEGRAVEALRQALDSKKEAEVGATVREILPTDWDNRGINNFNVDHRDPMIGDAFLRILQLREKSGGSVIATMLNWPDHPETIGDENLLISSDYPHYLRETIENGMDTPDGRVDGVGGVAIYWQGACGGMQSTLRADNLDVWGDSRREESYEKVQGIGEGVGKMVLEALPNIDWFSEPRLSVRTKTFKLRVDNIGYQIAFMANVFDRGLFDWDDTRPITDDNLPWLVTEVDVVELGKATLLTMPGELLPEYWHGGYFEPFANTGPLQSIIEGNENPPDLSTAPQGPYLIDHVAAEYPFLLGLANDELGYFVPPWQWELGLPNYLEEADGHHYEETNSVGPDTGPTVLGNLETLLEFTPPGW